ncbi:hypothetical protein COY90_03570 [Candidatus Roizmanbacteria bacterium CG_4_10_14_0_8_um_filter_39_9]|uniref:Dihydroorotate dehydrogenase (quinone) n=1 Tax=Candidatus Roizmanbacteria bacterium CG_4_10_14_0_8_um_filter_39_9 TaxID=1974829 RepID=A0A2M7QCD2_9BACT|nr:MAG: hypothetical protein COY90_03570 [Candidatus Roizmanbacteria bacterium CG_4_10_14_0_8_um_filter_39_9]
MKKLLFILILVGIVDSAYLTYEHFAGTLPICTINRFMPIFSDCGAVLRSSYSVLFGVPLALLGVIHYSLLAIALFVSEITGKKIWRIWILLEVSAGIVASSYFMYIQIGIIGTLCFYCTASAAISLILFILSLSQFANERKYMTQITAGLIYKTILKPLFFLIDPEVIHEAMLNAGEIIGGMGGLTKLMEYAFKYDDLVLLQRVAGITFQRPVGLAAGFDYEAKLTQALPSLGFGFESIGTITNMAYEGNPKPRLGRLPKSRSLMVNKGFKNEGAKAVSQKLEARAFSMPVGISIGRTNTIKLKTQKESVEDIIKAFTVFKKSRAKHSYYELNISCPNLKGDMSFYPPKNLKELLTAVEKLRIKRPIFIKMPIEKSDKEVKAMLDIIIKFPMIKGVVFGNLQKNRKDPSLYTSEVSRFKTGYFSGKPTEKRSNELIRLAYRKYGKKLIIIGCGGIFSAQDAYKKIKLGASLVQLITGMIYEGPQLVSQINLELVELLKKDGFNHVSEAVGVDS